MIMREILFMGKTTKGEWVYGVPVEVGEYVDMYRFNLDEMKIEHFLVIPESVRQYTGLHDKNSRKIFDGDIVKHPIGTFVVKFLGGTFCCSLIEADYLTDMRSIHNCCEVIGNIHDNKGLLKGSKQE